MCLSLLLLLLTSCSLLAQTPPDKAVELAIARQLSYTQQTLAQSLGVLDKQALKSSINPNFKIDSITVQSRDKITDLSSLGRKNLSQTVSEVYRVRGKFDTTLTASSLQKKQKGSPFEVLLGKAAAETNADSNPIETWYFIEQ